MLAPINVEIYMEQPNSGGWTWLCSSVTNRKGEKNSLLDKVIDQGQGSPILTLRNPGIGAGDSDPVQPLMQATHQVELSKCWCIEKCAAYLTCQCSVSLWIRY